jgi:hypothetical protein
MPERGSTAYKILEWLAVAAAFAVGVIAARLLFS